ncbi:MAG: hypothetical protein DYG89_33340 [Caldilinea sp. CFX5]|nr:hypothetical protein [Caldilinea sp. CFX5]
MSVRDYLAILWQRKFIIIITTAIVMLVAMIGALLLKPVYRASVKLQVSTAQRGSLDFIDYNLDYTDRLMNTYLHIAKSGPVLEQLRQQFHLAEAPVVDVTIIANTELMRLSVEGANPRLASNLANALAQILITQSTHSTTQREQQAQSDLEAQLAQAENELMLAQQSYDRLLKATPRVADKIIAAARDIDEQKSIYSSLVKQQEELRMRELFQRNQLSIIDPAPVPQHPLYPNLWLTSVLGLALGIVGGVGLAFLFEHFDDRLRSRSQIEVIAQTPILGELPKVQPPRPTLFFKDFGALTNPLLRLYTNLQVRTGAALPKVLLITSTLPNEGKSTVATGLAYLLQRSGQRVAIVDCNLRHPQLHAYFNIPSSTGLSNILRNQATLPQALCATIAPLLKVLPGGTQPEGDLITLHYAKVAMLVQQLKEQVDVVLLDGPALSLAPEGGALAALSEGTLLVVGTEQVRQGALADSIHTLRQLPTKVLGVIINRADGRDVSPPRLLLPAPQQGEVQPREEQLAQAQPTAAIIQPALSKKS